MEINKYALFADVAETKNFTKSGLRMGYTQPGVSRVLKTLENELGFPLFLRTKKGIELTSNARALLPLVRQLLADNEKIEQMIASFHSLENGHLTIACFASISRNWLPSILSSFQKQHPGIEIELLEGGTDDIVSWIGNSRADLGLLSRRRTCGLEWISLYEDPLMAILPENYPICGEPGFPLSEIKNQPFILSADGTDYDIHHVLSQTGIDPNTHFSSKDDLAIITMVANELGISILPDLVIRGTAERVQILPLNPFFSRELGIAYISKQGLTPAAARFIHVTRETLPELVS